MMATIRPFIAISVMLHLAAIAALYEPLPDGGSASPSLRVSIVRAQANASSEPAQAASALPLQSARPATPELVETQSRTSTQVKATRPRASVAKHKPVTGNLSGQGHADVQQAVERESQQDSDRTAVRAQRPTAIQTDEAGKLLRRLFAAHFNYPLLARRHGWQGEVRLGLRLEPDGRLTHIHIVESSGFPILDNSAVKTARKVKKAPDAAQWLRGEWFDMVLPVQYRLNGG